MRRLRRALPPAQGRNLATSSGPQSTQDSFSSKLLVPSLQTRVSPQWNGSLSRRGGLLHLRGQYARALSGTPVRTVEGSHSRMRASGWAFVAGGGAVLAAAYSASVILGGSGSGSGLMDGGEPLCKSVSVYASRGPRSAMEDEYYISPDERFFGVYDGHGGAKVSKFVRRHLHERLDAYEAQNDADGGPENALRKAFADVSKGILQNNKFDMQGSTAVTVLLGRDELWSANLGDSRAVLCRDGEAIDLTVDHKPNSVEEKSRIEALGGNVRWYGYLGPDRQPVQGMGAYRINGNLAVSRAFGDRLETPFVSDEPDVEKFDRDHDADRFIILASDGLWDVMTSQEAVKFVMQVMTGSVGALGQGEKKTRRPSRSLTKWMRQYSGDTNMVRAVLDTRKAKISKYLVEESLRRGTADNVTVIVIWL